MNEEEIMYQKTIMMFDEKIKIIEDEIADTDDESQQEYLKYKLEIINSHKDNITRFHCGEISGEEFVQNSEEFEKKFEDRYGKGKYYAEVNNKQDKTFTDTNELLCVLHSLKDQADANENMLKILPNGDPDIQKEIDKHEDFIKEVGQMIKDLGRLLMSPSHNIDESKLLEDFSTSYNKFYGEKSS